MVSGIRIRLLRSSWTRTGRTWMRMRNLRKCRDLGLIMVLMVLVLMRCMVRLRILTLRCRLIRTWLWRSTRRWWMVCLVCRGIAWKRMILIVNGARRLMSITCCALLLVRCGRRLNCSTRMCLLMSLVRRLTLSLLKLIGLLMSLAWLPSMVRVLLRKCMALL